MVVILSYFDFSASKERETTLFKTLESLESADEVILVAHNLNVKGRHFKNVRHIPVSSPSVVWQKERFYNIALSHIVKRHEYVAWLDADVIFCDDQWQDALKAQLQDYKLVQLFEQAEDVVPNEKGFEKTGLTRHSVIHHFDKNRLTPDDFFSKSGISLQLGCNPGFAWGARVSTIADCLFPDFFIVGGGDKALLAAAMGQHEALAKTIGLNSHLSGMYANWAEKVYEKMQGRVGYLSNVNIFHQVLGEYKNRKYANRHRLIADEAFGPSTFFHASEEAAWQWRNTQNEYALHIKQYFDDREN